jgi:hypothetical protein
MVGVVVVVVHVGKPTQARVFASPSTYAQASPPLLASKSIVKIPVSTPLPQVTLQEPSHFQLPTQGVGVGVGVGVP